MTETTDPIFALTLRARQAWAVIDALPGDDDEQERPAWDAASDAELAVIKCRPTSLEGLADKIICLLQFDLRCDGFPSYEEAAAFSGSHDTPALFIAIGRDAQALGSYAMSRDL